jgi:hypothetical protein
MPPRRIKIGRTNYAIVRSRDELSFFDEADARALVRRLVEENVSGARQIVDLAEELTGDYHHSLSDAIGTVARALMRGDVVGLRVDAEPEPLGRAARQVRDLRDPTPDAPHVGPRDTPRDEPAPQVRTWLSFEVVDDRGQPLLGEFRVAIDADEDAGELDDTTRRYDDIRAEADARLRLDLLRWDPTTRDEPTVTPDGPIPGGPPVAPDDAVTTFEVVGEDGTPWPGEFSLWRDDAVAEEGSLADAAAVRVEGGGALAVALRLAAGA